MKKTLRVLMTLSAILLVQPSGNAQLVTPAAGSGGSGAPFVYTFFGGIDQNTVAGWGVSCPSTGGGCPTLIPVEGASSGDVTTASSANLSSFLSFTKNASNSTANSVQLRDIVIPSTWSTSTKTITVDIGFRAVATSGNVVFQASGYCLTPPAVAPNFSSAISFTTTAVAGTTLQIKAVPTLTITPATDFLAACSAGDLLHLRIWRQGNSGSDTLSTGTCTSPASGSGCAELAYANVGVAQ